MYYPLSQIVTNLYTNGNQFVLSSTKAPYTGYYWKNSKGQFFTGKTPQDTPNEELLDAKTLNLTSTNEANVVSYYDYTPEVDKYLSLIGAPSTPPSPPTYFATLPTQKDYQNGEFRRYFCKKTNEILYLEISKTTYDKLNNQDSTIAYQYYTPINIPWQLTGDETDVYNTNRNIVELTTLKQKLLAFNRYLKNDFTKYYKKT